MLRLSVVYHAMPKWYSLLLLDTLYEHFSQVLNLKLKKNAHISVLFVNTWNIYYCHSCQVKPL